jgi:uncharacterized protein
MHIDRVVCPETIEEKLEVKHHVTMREVRQVLDANPRIRFAEKGNVEGDDVYVAFGQTFGGRYLSIFFVYKRATATAIIISARDMTHKEQRAYGRK